eukprot:scaffold5795_cov165-Amphora_coffeaeformis.AAC.1
MQSNDGFLWMGPIDYKTACVSQTKTEQNNASFQERTRAEEAGAAVGERLLWVVVAVGARVSIVSTAKFLTNSSARASAAKPTDKKASKSKELSSPLVRTTNPVLVSGSKNIREAAPGSLPS